MIVNSNDLQFVLFATFRCSKSMLHNRNIVVFLTKTSTLFCVVSLKVPMYVIVELQS